MISAIASPPPTTDLAGEFDTNPGPLRILKRIQRLQAQYLTEPILRERLEDLPAQFIQPTIRPWSAIRWSSVHPHQLVGIDLDPFCATLLGAINTEAPIRGYTQSSRQYLEPLYPDMARFVGGRVNAAGDMTEIGIWEREEKRHTPALVKLYRILSGESPPIAPHAARPYRPDSSASENLYRHGLHRVATEYGATCLYLWMMAHTTGALQAVLSELLIDEINHMTKFWGFGLWAYPQSSPWTVCRTLGRAMIRKTSDPCAQGSLLHTLSRMVDELAWKQWSAVNRLTFLYALDQVMKSLWRWNRTLTPTYLDAVLGCPLGDRA